MNEQGVGARIHYRAAALGENALRGAGQERSHRLAFLVTELVALGAQLFQIGDLLAGGQVDFFLGGDLVAGRNLDHVAVLAHVQTAALQDDVESLVPRHVLQAQGEVAAHRIADHHVQFGKIGDHVQCFANIDLLEIKRQFFAGIAGFLAFDQLVGIFDDGLYLDDEFIVGLVGGMFPLPPRFDHHAHVIALRKGVHSLYRGRIIGHVQFALQIFRQVGFKEIDYQRGALLPYVYPDIRIGEIDLHPAFAIIAAAKINVAQRMHLGVLFGFGKA